MKKGFIVALGMLAAGAANAQDLAVSGKLGTLGFGLELTKAFSDSVTGRVGLNGYSYSKGASQSGVDYDFKLKLNTVSFLADWYPMGGTFRTTAGLMYNNNKATLDAKPSTGQYTINNVVYNAADVGSLKGEMAFGKAAPYFGLGWGNPVAKEKTWGFVADVGVLYQASPKVTLDATCGAALSAVQCTSLQSDTAAERSQLESDLKNFKWYPVVSLGVSYRF